MSVRIPCRVTLCSQDTCPQVGIAAELPSGAWSDTNLDHRSFFRFLLDRGEAYERIPLERFNIHTYVLQYPELDTYSLTCDSSDLSGAA